MRFTYIHAAYFAVKGVVVLAFNAFYPDPAALWCGVGSLFVAAPLFAVIDHLGRDA